MRIRRCVDRLHSWTTMPQLWHFQVFCIGAESSGVINLNSAGKETRDKAPTRGNHGPDDFRPFFSIQPWSSWSDSWAACCSLWVLHVTTATPEEQMQRASCHAIFHVLKRPTSNVKKAKNWVAPMATRRTKNIAVLVTGVQFYWTIMLASWPGFAVWLIQMTVLLWFTIRRAITKKTDKTEYEFCFCFSSFRIRVGLRTKGLGMVVSNW